MQKFNSYTSYQAIIGTTNIDEKRQLIVAYIKETVAKADTKKKLTFEMSRIYSNVRFNNFITNLYLVGEGLGTIR